MNEFRIVKYQNDQTFIRHAPTHVDSVILATGGSSKVYSIPSSGKFVIFSSDIDFYARANSACGVPAADTTNGTQGEMNPESWALGGHDFPKVTGIHLVSAYTGRVTLTVYS